MQDLEQQLSRTLTPVPLTGEQKKRIKQMSEKNEPNLKEGIAKWAEKNNVRPVDFARAMGYSAAYGWSLLRGEAAMTTESLGRFVLAYGPDAAQDLLSLANTPASPEGPQA
jgi:hypothetical protein